ncbi:unnamed protein product, partial [Prorocentrum cordatum]
MGAPPESKKAKGAVIQEARASAEEAKRSGEKQRMPTEAVQSRVTKNMAGPNRGQRMDLLSISPERMGVRCKVSWTSATRSARGCCPARPFMDFNFAERTGVDKRATTMAGGDQMHEQHGEVASDYARADMLKGKEVKDAAVKMRARPWDLASLVKKSCEMRGVLVKPMNCRPVAAVLMGEFGTLGAGGSPRAQALGGRRAGAQAVAKLLDAE